MAKVKDNLVTEGLSGKLGKRLVFRHMRDGRTIIATRPDYRDHKWTDDQRTHHSRFQQAAAYARLASRSNPRYAELAAGTARNAYNLALSDWFHGPTIDRVTRQGNHIQVKVTDNVQVAKVHVIIFDEQGTTLEQGQADLISSDLWKYETLTDGNITVEAWDLAGNVTKATVVPSA